MRALDSKLASALVMQSPFLESPAGTKGCWLAPKASLAPERVQFLAPRWSLKRLPARAAARGLPKRRAGHLGTVAPSCHTAILHLGGFISGYRLFLTTTQASFCGVDQSPAHSPLQTAPGPRTPGWRHNTSTPPHCRRLLYRRRHHLEACPRPNLQILWIMDIRRGRTIYTFLARMNRLLTDRSPPTLGWFGPNGPMRSPIRSLFGCLE